MTVPCIQASWFLNVEGDSNPCASEYFLTVVDGNIG